MLLLSFVTHIRLSHHEVNEHGPHNLHRCQNAIRNILILNCLRQCKHASDGNKISNRESNCLKARRNASALYRHVVVDEGV